ncbi:MAG: serine hydrolase [Bacteroidota bacterium]|nr:serine hydrolase [Bacteroidota bacterium]
MKYRILIFIWILSLFICCSSEGDTTAKPEPEQELYFPDSENWESTSPEDLGWNTENINDLINFLDNSGTKAFIILKNGKIALEWYGNGEDSSSNLPWNSAGKTLSAFLMGIAQEEGYLSLEESSKKYLGAGWSSLTAEQEAHISIWNHITMTTGLDYEGDTFCYDPECLTYLNEPGTFWYYHNAPYTLTQDIIENAVNKDFRSYFNEKLRDRIGMNGAWITLGYNHVYFSNARSMARFGLLCLNQGNWKNAEIMTDKSYFSEMLHTSQPLNPSYGYLWWLNGKSSFRLPQSSSSFQGSIIPNAPDDLVAGLGANDQKLYISKSLKLVVVRMGASAGETQLGLSSYDNQLWDRLRKMIN